MGVELTDKMVEISKIKVSSVLNKNTKEYGKQFLIDGDCESCWQSDKSLNGTQTIILTFSEPTQITSLNLQFQGGFAASQVQWFIIGFRNISHLYSQKTHPTHRQQTKNNLSFSFTTHNAQHTVGLITTLRGPRARHRTS